MQLLICRATRCRYRCRAARCTFESPSIKRSNHAHLDTRRQRSIMVPVRSRRVEPGVLERAVLLRSRVDHRRVPSKYACLDPCVLDGTAGTPRSRLSERVSTRAFALASSIQLTATTTLSVIQSRITILDCFRAVASVTTIVQSGFRHNKIASTSESATREK